nr:transposase [Maribacter sp. Hal144]
MNYLSQLTVDTAHHVITDIRAYHADGKDNQQLPDIVKRVQRRLWKEGLVFENCVADTGYSSGENYAFLEGRGLRSFIPPHGTYKGGPTGFVYNEEQDHYLCPQGKVIPFTKVFLDARTGTKKKEYRARKHVCIDCPIRSSCLGKSAQEKKFSVTFYREEYERNIARVESPLGRYMKGKRQSTVEPVFGTLTQFIGLRKINTIGLKQANKVMHLAAIAYNLKKYLKFDQKRSKSGAGQLALAVFLKSVLETVLAAFKKSSGSNSILDMS